MVHLMTLRWDLLLQAISGDKAPDTYPLFFGSMVQNLYSTKCVCMDMLYYVCCAVLCGEGNRGKKIYVLITATDQLFPNF